MMGATPGLKLDNTLGSVGKALRPPAPVFHRFQPDNPQIVQIQGRGPTFLFFGFDRLEGVTSAPRCSDHAGGMTDPVHPQAGKG
jgi:hypothetical protein